MPFDWLAGLRVRLFQRSRFKIRTRRRRVEQSRISTIVEGLELRRMLTAPAVLTGSVLTVTGTTGVDVISLSEGTNLVVTFNGTDYSFPASAVSSVSITGDTGNDTISINSLNASDLFMVNLDLRSM